MYQKLMSLFSVLCLCTVPTFADTIYVDINAGGVEDGSSWNNAFTSFYDALDAAQEGDQIWIAAGTYQPSDDDITSFFTLKNGVEIYGGFTGEEEALEERDYEENETIFSGDLLGNDITGNFDENREDNARHIFWVEAGINETAVLDGVILRGGNTAGESGESDERRGAGIFCFGSPVIRNCTFTDNYAYFGSLYFRGSQGNGRAENCKIYGNFGYSGTAITIASPDTDDPGTPIIVDCEIYDNVGTFGACALLVNANPTFDECLIRDNVGEQGGGIFVNDLGTLGSSPLITNCIFEDNEAMDRGGAVYNSSDPGKTFIINCTFEGNSAVQGGAVVASSMSETDVLGCTFDDNNAVEAGGAIYTYDAAHVAIEDAVFIENESFNGACLGNASQAIYEVKNSMFVDNDAVNKGGVLFTVGCPVSFENCTFDGNDADWGGALYNVYSSAFVVDSCQFNESEANRGGAIFVTNTPTEVSNSSFTNNEGGDEGGAIFMNDSTTSIIENCHFDNNEADFGGAIRQVEGGGSYLVNCRFDDNTAEEQGGALIFEGDVNAIIHNSLFVNHSVPDDGGGALLTKGNSVVQFINNTVYGAGGCVTESGGLVIMRNSIFWNEENVELANNGGGINGEYCLIKNGFPNISNLLIDDPLFKNPSEMDFTLSAESPAIDSGTPDIESLNLPSVDLNGESRVQGDFIDLGAYEFGGMIDTTMMDTMDIDTMDMDTMMMSLHAPKDLIKLEVYPNPTSDYLFVRLDPQLLNEKLSVAVENIKGQRVLTTSRLPQNNRLDLVNLPKGVYILKLYNKERLVGEEKVVKK